MSTEIPVVVTAYFYPRSDAREHPTILMRLFGLVDLTRRPAPTIDELSAGFGVRPRGQEFAIRGDDVVERVPSLFGQCLRERIEMRNDRLGGADLDCREREYEQTCQPAQASSARA